MVNKLTRSQLNTFGGGGQTEVTKTKLKYTGKSFFAKNTTRERTYSGNEVLGMPSLETNLKSRLKTSESSDDLQKVVEEGGNGSHLTEIPEQSTIVQHKPTLSDEAKLKLEDMKRSNQKPNEHGFKDAHRGKKEYPKKQKRGKRKNKKVKDFHNWTYVQ